MKLCFSLMAMVLCSIYIVAGCSHNNNGLAPISNLENLAVTHSMKGWELYSWPEGNSWKFSFLMGTNRVKSLSEVTSSNNTEVLIQVTGVDSAKMVLNKFPQGEAVTILGQGWLQRAWQGQYGNLQLPPQTIINQLNSFAVQKSLTLTVVQ